MNAGSFALNAQETVEIFEQFVPCCVDAAGLKGLVDKHLSPTQLHDLQRRLGALFLVCAGAIGGHYRWVSRLRARRVTFLILGFRV